MIVSLSCTKKCLRMNAATVSHVHVHFLSLISCIQNLPARYMQACKFFNMKRN